MVTKFKAIKTPVAEVIQDVQPKEPMSYREQLHAAVEEMYGDTNVPAISAKRKLVATVLSFAAAFGTGYLIGTIISYALIGMALMSTSLFMMLMSYMLAIILAGYLGSVVGRAVHDAVIGHTVENAVADTYSYIKSLFSKSEPAAA